MKKIFTLTCLLALVAAFSYLIYSSEEKKEDLAYDIVSDNPYNYPKTDKPLEMFQVYKEMTYKNGKPTYGPGYKMKELNKAVANSKSSNARMVSQHFDERGPSNVPGRTRGLIVDPDDPTHQTWLAGTVGGGIWKTTDGGMSWINKTADFPNLSTTSLAYPKSNPDIIYAGTGEGWLGSAGFIGGSGIFKSTDRGETWTHLESTNNKDFDVINRIIVDPNNPDILLACTNNDPLFGTTFFSYILKSIDGGQTWNIVYEGGSFVQHIIADPNDFNILYASIRGVGVVKSTDAGETWVSKSNGLTPSGRIELAISPVDNNRLYASVEGNMTFQREDGGNGSDIYYSGDAGENWYLLAESSNKNIDYFNTQGWYDNTIMAHPFNADIVYVGGVGIFKVELQEGTAISDPTFAGAIEDNTSFLGLVNFGSGEFYGNKIATGNADPSEFTSIEIRFGSGKTQKAHRYTIPEGKGAGVPGSEYTYQDYVDVPFEVWDIDAEPPRQLMVGFRDQQADGVFNLIENNTAEGDEVNHSREYVYINAFDYNPDNPNTDMAKNGGHEAKDMYFIWPFLADGATWDPVNLPESKFVILWKALTKRDYAVKSVADVYSFLDGTNNFQQNTGETEVSGVHPDMHNLIPIIHDEANQEWQILNANDGGVYVSNIGTDPGVNNGDWTFAGNSLNTTQFYAVDKMPGKNRYIGGSQDNGTWLSQAGEESSEISKYARALGGDGFGTVWHSQNPDLILGSLYNLEIRKSTDGGITWKSSKSGISDKIPFITKMENSHSQPDIVYTIGESGVWKSKDFGSSWELVPINSNWSLASSFNNLEISDATPDVVWAGNRMDASGLLHVSTDNGETFTETSLYNEVAMGVVSGIASHPSDHKTAYALFSYAEAPKILRTTDLGQTWEDISGFSPNSTSTGFPDVAVMDMVVMPHDNNILWAGTEIGIFESIDNGATWHILEGNLPRASIWDMNINEDQLVIGTHGRGIWTHTLPKLPAITYVPTVTDANIGINSEIGVKFHFKSAFDSAIVFADNHKVGTLYGIAPGEVVEKFALDASGNVDVYTVGYKGLSPFTSNKLEVEVFGYEDAVTSYVNRFTEDEGYFAGSMEIKKGSGFDDGAIHTAHNYEVNREYIYNLRVPITIESTNSTLSYRDVAIIEPGDDGAVFGTEEFKDYVVVEASLNGIDWTILGEGYDANYNDRWRTLYNSSLAGDKDDFVFHEHNLLEYFEAGDVVVFRFRLHSDAQNNAWGWVIDDLNIQGIILSSKNMEPSTKVDVYPNPAKDLLTVRNAHKTISDAHLYSLNGVKAKAKLINTTELDVSNLAKGIYILKLKFEDGENLDLKVIKE